MATARTDLRGVRRKRWAISALVATGIAIPVVLGAWEIERLQVDRLRSHNELHADHLAAQLESALHLRLRLLGKLAGDLEAGVVQGRGAFSERARALVASFPELQAVNWLDAEAVARWVEPIEDNAPVLGTDIDELDRSREAVNRARETRQPTSTGIVELIQGGLGFATFYPVEGGQRGFVNGVFLLEPIAAGWLTKELAAEVRLSLTDDPLPEPEETAPRLRSTRAIGVLGRAFTLTVRPTALAWDDRSLPAGLVILFGLGLAVGVALLTQAMMWSRERALDEEAQRLALLAAVPDHMVRLGPTQKTVAYHRSAGLPRLPCHLPPGRWISAQLQSAIERALAEGRIVETSIELEGRSYAARVAPEPDRHVVVGLRDVTDRRRLEDERNLLAELVRSNGQLAAVVAHDGRLEYLNLAGQEMLGLGATSSARIQSFIDVPDALNRALSGGGPWSGRLELRSRDGTRLPAQVAAFPIQTAHGRKLGLLALDVRETVELERRLLQIQKLEAVGTLAAGVAHDFNNALTVFRTGLDLLEGTPDIPEDAREDLRLMRSAATSASQVAHQLLAFSRPAPAREVRFDVDEVLRGAERMLGRVVREGTELVLDLKAEGAAVDGDPGALQQVVLNLVSNARDAVEGQGRVTVSSRTAPFVDGQPGVTVEVRDDGAGMTEAQLARAFEPFFTTKAEGRGTGLGLAMVKRVTEALGGAVRIESAPGRGTAVELCFRRAEAPSGLEEKPVAPSPLLERLHAAGS